MKTNSKKTATEILNAVSEASGIPAKKLKSVSRKGEIALARGVYFALCRLYKVKGYLAAKEVNKKPQTSSYQSKVYADLLDIEDKQVCKLVEKVASLL